MFYNWIYQITYLFSNLRYKDQIKNKKIYRLTLVYIFQIIKKIILGFYGKYAYIYLYVYVYVYENIKFTYEVYKKNTFILYCYLI